MVNYYNSVYVCKANITPCITGDIKDFHTTKTESYIIRYRTQTVITLVGVFICIKHINYSIYVRCHKMFYFQTHIASNISDMIVLFLIRYHRLFSLPIYQIVHLSNKIAHTYRQLETI